MYAVLPVSEDDALSYCKHSVVVVHSDAPDCSHMQCYPCYKFTNGQVLNLVFKCLIN